MKTYLVGLTLLVKHLCLYYTRYQRKITENVMSSSLTDPQKAAILTFFQALIITCDSLRAITGY